MTTNVTTKQKARARVNFFRADGVTPATVAGTPVWSVDDSNLLALAVTADGTEADILPLGPEGTGVVTAVGNGDLSGGTRNVSASETFVVTVSAEAESATITVTAVDPV